MRYPEISSPPLRAEEAGAGKFECRPKTLHSDGRVKVGGPPRVRYSSGEGGVDPDVRVVP